MGPTLDFNNILTVRSFYFKLFRSGNLKVYKSEKYFEYFSNSKSFVTVKDSH